jgi:C1A family cysteine protease
MFPCGWCPLADMPYTPGNISTVPTAAQIASAKVFPGGAFHSIGNNIANMKSCILSDYSFVIGISVFDSFESDGAAATGLIPFPNVNAESLQGGHETHAGLGFDDTIQCPNSPNPGAVFCQNSWGDEWGCACRGALGTGRGFYWLSYDYLLNVNITSDIRMGHLGLPW